MTGVSAPGYSYKSAHERANLLQRLALDVGHDRFFRRMTDYQEQERFFVRWPVEQFVQKSHRTRRMGKRDQARLMNGRNQKSGRDADRFDRVIML